MPTKTRISLLAALAVLAALLGAPSASAASDTPVVLASGTSKTPAQLDPVARTAAGLVYRGGDYWSLWVRPTGGSAEQETRLNWPDVRGDLLSSYDYSSRSVVWRTIGDATLHTSVLGDFDTYSASTPTGFLALRSVEPGRFDLVATDLAAGEERTLGSFPTLTYAVQAGPAGAFVPSGPNEYSYLPYDGTPPTTVHNPSDSHCSTLTAAHVYCAVYSAGSTQVTRVPLSGADATPLPVEVTSMRATGSGLAYLTPSGAVEFLADAAAEPTQWLAADPAWTGSMAPSDDGSVLLARSGPLGQAGIWAVRPDGTKTLELAAPAQPRAASKIALAPGVAAWADNQDPGGDVWATDLTAGSGGLTKGAARLVAGSASGATLSISGDRLTYTGGSSSFAGSFLKDGDAAALQLNDSGMTSELSGDRLLLQSRVFGDVEVTHPWSVRDLRTGATTALPDARGYDLWGERLARFDDDGTVTVQDLRTGTSVRVADATEGMVTGTVQIAGDTVVWQVTTMPTEGDYVTTTYRRDLVSMGPAVELPGLQRLSGLSTGYAIGTQCSDGSCEQLAVALGGGQVTPLDGQDAMAVDGNTVGYVSADGLPTVRSLPAYTDTPRLLGSPAAPTTLAKGGSWTARVVASRVLTTCTVEISTAGAVQRTLPCTSPHSATTVTWDGKNTAGALVPDGQYTWRIVAETGGRALVDYDGTTKALSGTVAVSVGGSPPAALTARTPAVNATSVAVGANVTATFGSAVKAVDNGSFTLKDPAGKAVSAAVAYNTTTRVATLNPTADLKPDTKYTVTVAPAATSWSFVTGPAPAVTARTPATGATAVKTTGNVGVTFSEPVTGTGTATVQLRDPAGKVLPAAVGYNATTRVATLNPTADLKPDTKYTVTVTGGAKAVRDAAGNPLTTSSWSFTTGPAPAVSKQVPAASATAVKRTGNVTATFSEPVQGVSGTTATLRTSAGATVKAKVTYNATTRVLTLDPSSTLAARTKYTVKLTGGAAAIRDRAGNPLATVSWSFTTGS